MTEQYIPNLGDTPPSDARRDAVHIAVAPVVAKYGLCPGENVGMHEDGTVSEEAKPHIGVVDPFLEMGVIPGERFWLFLYPQTVTSLRHVWSHPAFQVKLPTSGKDEKKYAGDPAELFCAWCPNPYSPSPEHHPNSQLEHV